MAQVVVTFGAAVTKSRDGGAQVMDAFPRGSEEVTSSGTSAATTLTAGDGDVAEVSNLGTGVIWVKFGAAPVAAVEDAHVIGPGLTKWYGGLSEGDKAAVIDDS